MQFLEFKFEHLNLICKSETEMETVAETETETAKSPSADVLVQVKVKVEEKVKWNAMAARCDLLTQSTSAHTLTH